MKRPTDPMLAHTLLRLFVGVNIATHGVARIGSTGAFAAGLVRDFAATWLPAFSVRAFGTLVPTAELLIGSCLILGLALRPALIAGLLLLCALTFGTCLRQQWDGAAFQLIYACAYAALLARRDCAWGTVDGLLARRTTEGGRRS
jgi:thiosulfate dehydrogenase [quinone] large subunit